MISQKKVAVLTAALLVPVLLIVASAALAQEPVFIAKSDSPDPVYAGEELFYEIFITPPEDGMWWITDTLPPEVTYISDTLQPIPVPGGTYTFTEGCQLVGNELGCALWASPYEPRSFQIKTRVAPDAVAALDTGTVVANNVAWLTYYDFEEGPGGPLTFAAEGTFIEDLADLLVVKMSKPDTHVEAGELFTYTIFVENLGPSYARNVSIRDEILSSGTFTVVETILDPIRDDAGPYYEPSPQGGLTIEFDLLEPLEPKDIWNAGRWVIQLVLRAEETQDVNNLVNVFSGDPDGPEGPGMPTADPDLSNNLAQDFIYVTDVADLSVGKYLDECWADGFDGFNEDGGCVAGGMAEFELEVYNDGPSTAENVVVEDLLPAGVTVVDVWGDGSCTTGIPGDPLAPLTCNLGNIPPGQWRYINIEVQIDPDYVDPELPSDYRLLENDAWVYSDIFDPDNSDNRDHVIVDVYTYSELAITKWGFPALAGPGDDVEYEIRIRNLGPSTVDMLHFVDLLPPTVDYEDYWIEQGTGTCTYHDYLPWPWWEDYRGVHCYVDEIPPNGVVMVHLTGQYNYDLLYTEDMLEVCNIIPDDDPFSGVSDAFGVDDPFYMPGWFADSYVAAVFENSPIFIGEDEYFGWCPEELYIEADLSIDKTSEPMKIYPGEQKVYHIEVTNNGPTVAPDVMVTDTLPIGLNYEIDNDSCTLFSEDPDVLECYLGDMMPGDTAAFDIWALVLPDTPPGEITNEAVVYMEYDPNPDNNVATATNLVLDPIAADLGIDKWWEEAPEEWFDGVPWDIEDCYLYDEYTMDLFGVRAGCPLRYGLVVTNTGPLLAENVVVEDLLPAGVTVEGVGAPGSCTTGIPGDPSAPLTCNLGNIPPGEDRWIEVFVMTDADLAWELLENDALVYSDIFDSDNGNNRAHVLIWVEPFSYLDLVKGGPEEIMAGEEIHYHIDINNMGPSTAHDVYLEDELPWGVSLLDAQVMIGDGSCAPDTTLCSLGDMEPWDYRSVRVRGYVEPWLEEGTLITNTVRAWAHSPFNSPDGPISDTLETLVHSAADLSIRKTSDPYKVYAGEQKRYDIEVTNHGPGVAFNVVVSDTLPPGVEFEIATTDCEIMYTESLSPTMLGATPPDEGGDTLFSVDLGTGAGSYIGPTPEWLAAEIEYDNLSGRLFASMGFRPWFWDWYYNDGFEPPRLYELDPATGASLGYVHLDEPCALPGLEFVGDTLYGACSEVMPWFGGGEPYLVTVDPDTGHVSYVGETDLDDRLIHGMAYDESSETMYGITAWPWDGPNELVTIDLDDGEAHHVCDIWDADDEGYEYDLRSIEFGPDGLLYGGLTWDSDLVVIDPTPTENNGQYCNMYHVGDTGFSVTGLTLADLRTPIGTACHLGDIPPGETREFSIFVRVKPDTLGYINNEVDVWSETEDPNPGNNFDSELNLVLGKADLKVTKFGKPDGEVRAGEVLEYWVIVDNLGPGFAHDVVLYDIIASDGEFELWWEEYDNGPDGGEFDCWVDGCYDDDGYYECYEDAYLTCRLNDPLPVMSPESPGRWLLKVWVEAWEEQSINNVAHVVSSDFDPDPSNNQATVEHDITAVADLELSKEAWGEVLVGCEGETEMWEDEVAAGGELTYVLEIYNSGPSTAENVVVEDWGISPFLDIVDVECDKGGEDEYCSCNTSELGELGDENRRLVCYLGTLDNDDEDHIIITARVPSDVPEGTRLVNDARVYGDVFDDDNSDDLVTNWTTVSTWADLEVVKTQDPEIALPTWEMTYTITVANLGLSDVQGVIISDTTPLPLQNVTWTCCASDEGECDVPCEPPTCPVEPCPWPEIGLYAMADIPAGEWVIYTVSGTLDFWSCGPFTNTVEVVAPESLVHPLEDIDPCDENNVSYVVNDPFCHYDPLVMKEYGGPDSTP